ncbi:MAG: hypothetical protein LIO44_05985 [Eubacterium sp.]|nr:hypothetical protein [Eubacterium sp.]
MVDIKVVADEADMIVNGYAFTKCDLGVRVLNLNNPVKAVVLDSNGKVVATSMDDIEISIVADYYERNKKFMDMEVQSA